MKDVKPHLSIFTISPGFKIRLGARVFVDRSFHSHLKVGDGFIPIQLTRSNYLINPLKERGLNFDPKGFSPTNIFVDLIGFENGTLVEQFGAEAFGCYVLTDFSINRSCKFGIGLLEWKCNCDSPKTGCHFKSWNIYFKDGFRCVYCNGIVKFELKEIPDELVVYESHYMIGKDLLFRAPYNWTFWVMDFDKRKVNLIRSTEAGLFLDREISRKLCLDLVKLPESFWEV